jgi:hypothetical protein
VNDDNQLEEKDLTAAALDQKGSRQDEEETRTASELGQAKTDTDLSMHIKVHSPFRDYFDDQAFSISAENGTGPFDILPHHHNFISLLNPCELVIRSSRESTTVPTRIQISGGLMHVKSDEIVVFLDV